MSHNLHLASVRKALKPRREPYWAAPLARGKYIGLRKIDAERATWIARLRDDAGQQAYRSLGYLSDAFDFDAAKAAAEAWFKTRESGITDEVCTVADACKAYVEDRRREKGEATAHDAEKRFQRTVYKTTFGDIALAKLRTPHLKTWRDGLKLSKASSNRTLTALKAALNLAVTHRQVSPAARQEWADVKPHKDAGKRRDLYLDLAQRRALLQHASGALHDLIAAATLTGARAGELVNAARSQFDHRTGSMTFIGKTGRRVAPLSPAAVELFARLAKGKLPTARLLTRDDGKPWAHSDWDELLREAATKAGLPKGTCLYTCRHSFITQLLTGGADVLQVARLVGTSITMIERNYGHLCAAAARERLAAVVMA